MDELHRHGVHAGDESTDAEVEADQLRFAAYRGPASLLGVLVREGDLHPRAVPVAALAEAARRQVTDADEVDGPAAIEVLTSLTQVWEARLHRTRQPGETVLPEDPAGLASLPPDVVWGIRTLRALEEREVHLIQRAPLERPGLRLGSSDDLMTALRRWRDRQRRRVSVVRLWPTPAQSPFLSQVRRLLAAVRRGEGPVEVVPPGLRRDAQVAAVQAALELRKKGRLRLLQEAPYARVWAVGESGIPWSSRGNERGPFPEGTERGTGAG